MALDLNYQPQEVVETDGMPNEEWLKYRTTGIGGSDVAAIYEVSPWTTKRALYYAKIGLEKEEAPNPYTLMFGHAMEPFVVQWFLCNKEKNIEMLSEKLAMKIADFYIIKDTMMYRHPLFPMMQANLDYRIVCIDSNGVEHNGIFECKTTSFHIGPDAWKDGAVPYYYMLQCRHYMAVMNVDFTVIACAWGNNALDYKSQVILRDLDAEEDQIEMEQDFWENNVLLRNPPPLSQEHAEQESAAFKAYRIRDRIKAGELKEIEHPKDEILGAVKDFQKAQEMLAVLKNKQTEAENLKKAASVTILESMPNDDELVMKDGTSSVMCAIRTTKRKTIDGDRLKKEMPEIAKEFIKVSESQSLKVIKLS